MLVELPVLRLLPIVMVMPMPFGLHSLDGLLMQQLDAIHERHNAQIGVIDTSSTVCTHASDSPPT